MGYSVIVLSRCGSLLPSMYADGRYVDDVIVFNRPSAPAITTSKANYLDSIARGGAATPAAGAAGAAAAAASVGEYYVDGKHGSDANGGSSASPVATIEAGVALCRKAKKRSAGAGTTERTCTVVVLPANYYLSATLALAAGVDNGLQIKGLPDGDSQEMPVVSGGVLLDRLVWKPAAATEGTCTCFRCLFRGMGFGPAVRVLPVLVAALRTAHFIVRVLSSTALCTCLFC